MTVILDLCKLRLNLERSNTLFQKFAQVLQLKYMKRTVYREVQKQSAVTRKAGLGVVFFVSAYVCSTFLSGFRLHSASFQKILNLTFSRAISNQNRSDSREAGHSAACFHLMQTKSGKLRNLLRPRRVQFIECGSSSARKQLSLLLAKQTLTLDPIQSRGTREYRRPKLAACCRQMTIGVVLFG